MKITLALVCLSLSAFGQKVKSFKVADLMNGVSITGIMRYDESNYPFDTVYYMSGKNQKYQAIIDIISLYSGHKLGLKALLKKCLETFNEDYGVSIRWNDHYMHIDKIMGIKGLTLYGIDDDSDGYVHLNKSQTTKLISKLK